MNKEQSVIALILGRKGTGKTTLLKKIIKKKRKSKTFLVIDKLDKFGDISDCSSGNAFEIHSILRSPESKNQVIRLLSSDEKEITGSIIAAYTRGNVVIVMDECDTIFGVNASPRVLDIILRGRNQGLDFILATLRPHRVNIEVRNNADYLFIFSIVSKVALQAITQEFGVVRIMDAMEKIKGFEYIKYSVNDNTVEIYDKSGTPSRTKKQVSGSKPVKKGSAKKKKKKKKAG